MATRKDYNTEVVLTEDFKLRKGLKGVDLVRSFKRKNRDTGEEYDGEQSYFYGTTYQALQGFLHYSLKSEVENIDVENMKEVHELVQSTMKLIESKEAEIKKAFSTIVYKA